MNEKQNNDQEIDILPFFNLLAKKTKSVFVLIINLLISIFNLFISLLFVIKKNYILLFSGALLVVAILIVESLMLIEPVTLDPLSYNTQVFPK